jgi:hypothetical protein
MNRAASIRLKMEVNARAEILVQIKKTRAQLKEEEKRNDLEGDAEYEAT